MSKKITMLGALVVLATVCNSAFAQAPTGAYDFGAAVVSNTLSGTGGGPNCGIFNTPDPNVGNTTMALRGNGKKAIKFFLNDITYYTLDGSGNEVNAYTYSGSVIMTLSSATGGALKWIAEAAGATFPGDGSVDYTTFTGVGKFTNYALEDLDGGGIKLDFDITIKDCTFKLDAGLYP